MLWREWSLFSRRMENKGLNQLKWKAFQNIALGNHLFNWIGFHSIPFFACCPRHDLRVISTLHQLRPKGSKKVKLGGMVRWRANSWCGDEWEWFEEEELIWKERILWLKEGWEERKKDGKKGRRKEEGYLKLWCGTHSLESFLLNVLYPFKWIFFADKRQRMKDLIMNE